MSKPREPSDVVELVYCILDSLSEAEAAIRSAVRDTTWAYQDMLKDSSPFDSASNGQQVAQSLASETATRSVFPSYLPEAMRKAENALDLMDLLERILSEKTHGEAEAPVQPVPAQADPAGGVEDSGRDPAR